MASNFPRGNLMFSTGIESRFDLDIGFAGQVLRSRFSRSSISPKCVFWFFGEELRNVLLPTVCYVVLSRIFVRLQNWKF